MPLAFVTASVVFRDETGALLTVRKRGTSRFMLPGGKLEPGEAPLDAAIREAGEEVGAVIGPDDLTWLGGWSAAAANEPGAVVTSDVYVCRVPLSPQVAGEIEESRWQPLDVGVTLPDDLAPLLTEHVIPALRSRWPGSR